jgi:hypothetical protein
MMLITVSEWWMAKERPEQIFWVLALVFSVLLFIQFILSLTHLDTARENQHSSKSQRHLPVLSMQSWLAFFAILGWTGVFTIGVGTSVWLSILLGLVLGGIAMTLVAWLFFWFSRLG